MSTKASRLDGRPDAPCRFAVDDVTASAERLQTTEQDVMLGRKTERRILFSSQPGRRVVAAGGNPLVAAIHAAFSRHLPLVLSPDDIWLTIAQGFSQHVNQNAESLRGRLVRHQGRERLTESICGLPNLENLAPAIARLSRQIRDATDPVLYEALVCNFTTTTPEARTASEISVMDTFSRYFDYSILVCVCGIPTITLTGTAQDWRSIRSRIEVFEAFGLGWWLARLRPILDEFVCAAEGRPNQDFWRGIYKFRPGHGLYEPAVVTGWIVNLFPYLSDSLKMRRSHVFDSECNQSDDGQDGVADDAFPRGLSSVEVQFVYHSPPPANTVLGEQMLELFAGMCGVEQDEHDASVSPTIGWCLAVRTSEPVPFDYRQGKRKAFPEWIRKWFGTTAQVPT